MDKIYTFCATKEKAEEVKLEFENSIFAAKEKYKKEYNTNKIQINAIRFKN